MESCLYFGRVMHKRLRPFAHRFMYRVFSIWLDLDELATLDRELRLFSVNRWNLFSFHEADHGARDGGKLRDWIEASLLAANIDLEGGRVRLLCFPRIFGFVFNPLTVWFCYHRDGRLLAVLHEVRNTFGEKHGYLFDFPEGQDPTAPIRQSCDKAFYVSPFIGMQARYAFKFRTPGEKLSIVIQEDVPEGQLLVATQTGERARLSDAALASALFAYPLLTVKVVAAIHWEALRLWLKGARYHARPRPPEQDVELVRRVPEPAE
jgi:DUF1365 family protein